MTHAAPTPSIAPGMPATLAVYTDAYACTVVAVSKSGAVVTLRRDRATLLNGAGSGEADALRFYAGGFAAHAPGAQRYAYEADPAGEVYVVRRRKDGSYREAGSGARAQFGVRREHRDFNF